MSLLRAEVDILAVLETGRSSRVISKSPGGGGLAMLERLFATGVQINIKLM